MTTWHIHIKGMVQGVGFRPHVYRLAKSMHVNGWVNNTNTGVHIMASADEPVLKKFYQQLIQHPPANAVIQTHHADCVASQQFDDFYIQPSDGGKHPDLLITPDFGLCTDCRQELFDDHNRRYHYPFITCTQCGPRYSIMTGLPYDREATTMEPYDQCWQCKREYHNPDHRRYYSQTNSCSDCGIPMYFYNSEGACICRDYACILVMLQEALAQGNIVAVKGTGGYLLLCDATNSLAITTLRSRKQRPQKPFAVLYDSISSAEQDVLLHDEERGALGSIEAPIVLCHLRNEQPSGICVSSIAPHLNRIGIMLPYTPLLALIAEGFKKPLIATSGNISGSPIIYNDIDALEQLSGIADFFLTYDREIVVPQDDSVLQFANKSRQKIILRRSRGLAPNYFNPILQPDVCALATGAELKGSFALSDGHLCYVSQYLGDQSQFESQQAYKLTLQHLTRMMRFEPEVILVDKHPNYFISQAGKELAAKHHLPVLNIQHHKAHFASVLSENNLLESEEPVLGVIWDGTGYGDDQQIWGGEFFIYVECSFSRTAHLDYFPILASDKMSREPRLSALSLLYKVSGHDAVRVKFSEQEYNYYLSFLNRHEGIQTSSMGRLLDGVASLLDICDQSSYEGEAAMQLEALALTCMHLPDDPYSILLQDGIVYWQPMIREILMDLKQGIPKNRIAYRVHLSLAEMIRLVAHHHGLSKIAFSGGTMQNALLTDLFFEQFKEKELYFHQQLSPNDECISFGQLAYLRIQSLYARASKQTIELTI